MRVISFGHIPSWAGGLQESGLANVIYQIAKHMSCSEEIEMSMVATDVFVPIRKDGNLTIYGWTKRILILYAICHLCFSFRWFALVILAKIKYGSIVNIGGYFFKGLHLSRIIRKIKPDAVHLHSMTACVYVKVIPKHIKVITTMHGIIGKDTTIKHQKYLFKMERDVCFSSRYNLLVFIATDLINQFKSTYGFIASPYNVILNAYDSNALYFITPQKHDGLVLATIASFSENKGQKRVIEAISNSGMKVKYICIGDSTPEFEKEYVSFAQTKGVIFDYKGKKRPSEIREVLSNVDYMVLPSSTEGFGLVFLEAIACGIPVVLPKQLPIVKETGIIKPGINAVLLDDCSVNSISEIMPVLGKSSFEHKEVAESIVSYNWDNIARKYIECFKEI